MRAMLKWILAIACAAPALAANAQTASYDFTATVTSSSGFPYGLIAPGSTITGTYTIDLSAANESIDLGSSGLLGIAAATGGSEEGTLAPAKPVFASTAKTGVLPFSSGAPAAYYSASLVETTPPDAHGIESYAAAELNQYSFGVSSASFFELTGADLFASNGLLTLGGSTAQDVGGFTETGFGSTNTVTYDITSLTAAPTSAPEIDAGGTTTAASLLVGGLLVLRGRRRDGDAGRA